MDLALDFVADITKGLTGFAFSLKSAVIFSCYVVIGSNNLFTNAVPKTVTNALCLNLLSTQLVTRERIKGYGSIWSLVGGIICDITLNHA